MTATDHPGLPAVDAGPAIPIPTDGLPAWTVPYDERDFDGHEWNVTYALRAQFEKTDASSYIYGPEATLADESIDLVVNTLDSGSSRAAPSAESQYTGIEIKTSRGAVVAPGTSEQLHRYISTGELDCVYLCVPAWVRPIASEVPEPVGILHYAPSDGEVTVTRPAQLLDRTQLPAVARTDTTPESEVAYRAYDYYRGQPDCQVVAEAPLPGTRATHGAADSIKDRTIDLLVVTDDERCGIEIKGYDPDFGELDRQVRDYQYAANLDRLFVAAPAGADSAADAVAEYLEYNWPAVGMLEVTRDTNGDTIHQRRPSEVSFESEVMWKCSDCGITHNETVIPESRLCPNPGCDGQLW